MTPMVDVVFLLLIFFMLTASFALQKTIESSPPNVQDAATVTPHLEQEMENAPLMVYLDEDDTVWVDNEKMPTRQALISTLRRNISNLPTTQPTTLRVIANPLALHSSVVMVVDVGNGLRIPNIQIETSEERR